MSLEKRTNKEWTRRELLVKGGMALLGGIALTQLMEAIPVSEAKARLTTEPVEHSYNKKSAKYESIESKISDENEIIEPAFSKEGFKLRYQNITPPKVGWEEIEKENNYKNVQLADKDTIIGRLQRALRWKSITDAAERKYGMKKGILLAMIMQESYGDPIQPNMRSDGGLGLMHMQPVVAHSYGLKVFGDNTVLASRKYGKKLDKFLESCGYDMKCIYTSDERIHPILNIDAGARIVMDGYRTHKRWEHAVESYYAPGLVGRFRAWLYLKNVTKWYSALNNKKLMAQAEADFNQRNAHKNVIGTEDKLTFKEYLKGFSEICNNYGLSEYKKFNPFKRKK